MRPHRWIVVLHGYTGPLAITGRFWRRRQAERYAWRHRGDGHAYTIHRADAELPAGVIR